MHLSALPAAVISLALAACGSLIPSPELLGSATKTPDEIKPEGYVTEIASVTLEPVTGVPQPVFSHLVRMLDAASRPAGLALLNYTGAQGDYRLKGDLKAFRQNNKVKVTYNWELFDRAGARMGGAKGTEFVPATGQDPWNSITEPALRVIARQGITLVAGIAKAGPAVTGEVAAGAALPKVSLSSPAETAPMVSNVAVQSPISGDKNVIDPFEALRLVNDFRKSQGLQPLTLNQNLNTAASALAADMARHDRLSHSGPNGADLAKRLKAAGYAYAVAAENVGVGQQSLAELIGEWKKSASESQNLLLPDAKQMGIAYRYRPESALKTFWTLIIASSS